MFTISLPINMEVISRLGLSRRSDTRSPTPPSRRMARTLGRGREKRAVSLAENPAEQSMRKTKAASRKSRSASISQCLPAECNKDVFAPEVRGQAQILPLP